MSAKSLRGCIIATTQMFGLVRKDGEDFKDDLRALSNDARQAIASDRS
jgi:hypothetical protein